MLEVYLFCFLTTDQISQNLCPAYSILNDAGASVITDCTCVAGYYGSDGSECSACLKGTYKMEMGDSGCEQCQAGKYSGSVAAISPTQCKQCANHSSSEPGSSSITDCMCSAGYFGLRGGECTRCIQGSFCIGGDQMLDCPLNSWSEEGAEIVTKCSCNMGYTGPDGGNCVACSPGSIKSHAGFASCNFCDVGKYTEVSAGTHCAECPLHTIAPEGSSAQAACMCNAGYSDQDGGEDGACMPCNQGWHKQEIGSRICTECPAGTFASIIGATSCEACPITNMTSLVHSTSALDCFCAGDLTLSGSLNDGVCVSREVIVEAVEIIKLVDIERIVYVNVTKVVPTTVYVPWEIHRFSQLKQNHTTWGNRLCVRVRIFFWLCYCLSMHICVHVF